MQGGMALSGEAGEHEAMDEDEDDEEMAYEDEEGDDEADVPSAEHMSVGSTEVHDMLLGSEASPARSAPPTTEPSRRSRPCCARPCAVRT